MRYFTGPFNGCYWAYDGTSMWFYSAIRPNGSEVDSAFIPNILHKAETEPYTDGEIDEKSIHDIRASWNLPAPVTPPEVEGLVKALEMIAEKAEPLPPGYGNDSTFAQIHSIATTALATYRARLTPPPAPSVTGGGT